ncbi:MAG: RNA polymerase sigma factor [Myxococcaceae bacterium]
MDDIADSEAAVLDALSRSDRNRALTLLMGRYGQAVYNYCRHMLGNDALAEDVHQTTFAQAYSDFGRYRGRSSLRNWLWGIARHRCLDTLKMLRRENKHVEHPETTPDIATTEPGAEEQLQLGSIGKHLAECIGRLDAEVRDAILLRFMEQLSYEEMAQMTGVRAATLQMRVARAMKGLRQCLEASGVTP